VKFAYVITSLFGLQDIESGDVYLICMFVWGVGTTEYKSSRVMMGARYVNKPKHKQSERILCGVFTKLHGSSHN